MLIRKADAADLDSILSLSKAWANEGITQGMVAGELADFSDHEIWVYIDDDVAIAYLSGSLEHSENLCVFPSNVQYFEVDELYVIPERRAQNIGSMLYQHVEHELVQRGIRHLLLSSASIQHQKIIDFYQRNGFDLWTMVFFKNIEG